MRPLPVVAALLFLMCCRPAYAGQKTVTFYLDGARVEEEITAVKGYLGYSLPESAVAGSLRVKPAGEGRVLRVELVPAERDRRRAAEIGRLELRKRELQDRLENLSRREEIFSAAARSQGGKAPRKSKANPDALESLQQGTAFAVGQLEAVYRSQRNCRRALEEVDEKIAAARKGVAFAAIWLSGNKATVSFLVAKEKWTPSYDFRWSGDEGGELLLHAKLPAAQKKVRYQVSLGTVSEGAAAKPVQGDFPVLARYPLTLQKGGRSDAGPFSFTFQPVGAALPPGEASAFWRGEYLGSGRFAGGKACQLSLASQ